MEDMHEAVDKKLGPGTMSTCSRRSSMHGEPLIVTRRKRLATVCKIWERMFVESSISLGVKRTRTRFKGSHRINSFGMFFFFSPASFYSLFSLLSFSSFFFSSYSLNTVPIPLSLIVHLFLTHSSSRLRLRLRLTAETMIREELGDEEVERLDKHEEEGEDEDDYEEERRRGRRTEKSSRGERMIRQRKKERIQTRQHREERRWRWRWRELPALLQDKRDIGKRCELNRWGWYRGG